MVRPALLVACVAALSFGCSSAPGAGPTPEAVAHAHSALTPFVSGSAIVSLALANVGGSACGTNTLGGTNFETSCTGNGGQPEYWCADFAQWVWANSGVDTSGLDAAAGSFYVYGQNNGTLSNTPVPGDAVVFDYQGGGVADHVAIVTQVNSDGTIESVSGDWGGQSGSEATFSSTSSVVLNSPAYDGTVGATPGVIGMTISGYIAPKGGLTQGYGASYVSQSFPLATTALQMTAGQVLDSYIEMKNTGGQSWDSNTRLATSNPRDRKSVFADSTWIADNRPAAVSGSVAPGSSFKFQFKLHAPATPGTYFEYFNLVQEGVNWFSDPGQGGPPDNDLEVQVVVTAAPQKPDAGGGSSGSSSGAGASSSGGTTTDGGVVIGGSSGGVGGSSSGVASDDAGAQDDGGSWGNGASPSGASGGCSVARPIGSSDFGAIGGVAMALGLALLRRRGAKGTVYR